MINKTILLFILLCYSCNSNPSNDSVSQAEDIASVEAITKHDNASNDQQVENEKEDLGIVKEFISLVEKKDIKKLAEKVSYPLKRRLPLPMVKDETAFFNRFHEIFDDSLQLLIIDSSPKFDWSEMGSEGIMLLRGEVWLDYNGNLIAVNYQSDFEKQKSVQLIANDKSSLHPSLRNFKKPTAILESESYKIRIDELDDGKYRYASWKINSSMDQKPDLILGDGQCVFQGSGGNHYFEFINNDYKYVCQINRLGEDDTPPAELIVFENGARILSEDCVVVGE